MSLSNMIGMNDAASHLGELLTRVADGEEITITREGAAVAKLVPISATPGAEDRRKLIREMRELASRTQLNGLSIQEMIAEGRR